MPPAEQARPGEARQARELVLRAQPQGRGAEIIAARCPDETCVQRRLGIAVLVDMDHGSLEEGLVIRGETREARHIGPQRPMERQPVAEFAEALRRVAAIARARRIDEAGEDDRTARMRVGRGQDGAGLHVDRPIARLAVERSEDRLVIPARGARLGP